MQSIILAISFLAAQLNHTNSVSTHFFGIECEMLTSRKAYEVAYDFENPAKTFRLPKVLEEVSGLGIDPSGKYIVAVQDEKGIAFFVDCEYGKLDHSIEFWKDGDYEGIEIAQGKLYAVKSTGTVYEVNDFGTSKQAINKFNFFLNEDNDVEGLAYYPKRNSLLLACKAMAGKDDTYRYKKGIYEFDLDKKMLKEDPFLLISLEAVNDYLDTSPMIRKLEKVVEFFQPTNNNFSFSPSAIAIHPKTGEIYITSSVGKLLMITNDSGKILHIENLKKSIHPQPEGLCFDKEGNLYLANESKSGLPGTIYRFDYKN